MSYCIFHCALTDKKNFIFYHNKFSSNYYSKAKQNNVAIYFVETSTQIGIFGWEHFRSISTFLSKHRYLISTCWCAYYLPTWKCYFKLQLQRLITRLLNFNIECANFTSLWSTLNIRIWKNTLSIKWKLSDFEMRNISYSSKIDFCLLIWDKYQLILENFQIYWYLEILNYIEKL